MQVQFIKFSIPLYEKDNQAFINLDVEKLKEAKKGKCKVVVVLNGKYCKPVDPSIILKTGKKSEQVFLFPENPMKLRGYFFSLFDEETQQKIKEQPHFWYYY